MSGPDNFSINDNIFSLCFNGMRLRLINEKRFGCNLCRALLIPAIDGQSPGLQRGKFFQTTEGVKFYAFSTL